MYLDLSSALGDSFHFDIRWFVSPRHTVWQTATKRTFRFTRYEANLDWDEDNCSKLTIKKMPSLYITFFCVLFCFISVSFSVSFHIISVDRHFVFFVSSEHFPRRTNAQRRQKNQNHDGQRGKWHEDMKENQSEAISCPNFFWLSIVYLPHAWY